MYWIEDGNGRRQPRANAPQVRITNLQEVFGMLDAGTDPCVAHADYHIGDTEEHRALADAIQEQMIYQALCREATTRGKWIER